MLDIHLSLKSEIDPFYSRENQEHLKKVVNKYEEGKSRLISKDIAELEEMEALPESEKVK